jgi:hypothetical protein
MAGGARAQDKITFYPLVMRGESIRSGCHLGKIDKNHGSAREWINI